MQNLSNYTRIKRTINALYYPYLLWAYNKEEVKRCLSDKDFQHKYIEY